MEQSELLRYVTVALEGLGAPYFVTGALATTYFGEPRFANHIDIVLDLAPQQLHGVYRAFPPPAFYLSDGDALEAILSHTRQFQVIDLASGLKANFTVTQASPFDLSRFARAQRVRVADDVEVALASAEDAIVEKMLYYREDGLAEHLRDITGVLKISGDRVDRNYITHWASQLGVSDVWDAVLRRSPG